MSLPGNDSKSGFPGAHSADQTGFELRSAGLCLPNAGIKGLHCHAQLLKPIFFNDGKIQDKIYFIFLLRLFSSTVILHNEFFFLSPKMTEIPLRWGGCGEMLI